MIGWETSNSAIDLHQPEKNPDPIFDRFHRPFTHRAHSPDQADLGKRANGFALDETPDRDAPFRRVHLDMRGNPLRHF